MTKAPFSAIILAMWLRNAHHPPHWHESETWYALTACTYHRVPALRPTEEKVYARDKLSELVGAFELDLAAWVLLDDHYHLLVKFRAAECVSKFAQRRHGAMSHHVNSREGLRGRRVWQNYWDTCIRDERGFWTRMNYIHHNPVKHGYVNAAGDYAFSNYGCYVQMKGQEWLADVQRLYPVRDYTDPND